MTDDHIIYHVSDESGEHLFQLRTKRELVAGDILRAGGDPYLIVKRLIDVGPDMRTDHYLKCQVEIEGGKYGSSCPALVVRWIGR